MLLKQTVTRFAVLAVLFLAASAAAEQAAAPAPAPEPEGPVSSAEPAAPDGDLPWFDDLASVSRPTPADTETVARRLLADCLAGHGALGELPDSVLEDTALRIVFLSVSDGRHAASVHLGWGAGLATAARNALSAAREGSERADAPVWAKVDVVTGVSEPFTLTFRRQAIGDPGLHGLAFGDECRLAFLPDELMARSLLMGDLFLDPEAVKNYVGAANPLWPALMRMLDRERFLARCFVCDSYFSDGAAVIRLMRGHRMFGPLATKGLLNAARTGGDYLVRSIDGDGRFLYDYDAPHDRPADRYNLVRHAGTLFSMFQLYEVTRDEELLDAAERALAYMVEQARPVASSAGDAATLVEDGWSALGGDALGLLAIAQYVRATGSRRHLDVARRLATAIVDKVGPDGGFPVQKVRYADGWATDLDSEYYPGEAALALIRLYGVDPDERWLDAAARAALYLINVRDGGVPLAEQIHDHWLLYALNDLYRARPEKAFLDHSRRITTAILESQIRSGAPADWVGGYGVPPRCTPAATRNEGLSAAYMLERDFGDSAQAEEILDAIQLGTDFTLQMWCLPESVLYLPNPQRALGGFRGSLTDYSIRIDFVQHNVCAMLSLMAILNQRTDAP